MSNLPYKNPISPIQLLGNQTVSRTDTFGTNFSVLSTGGYMEVYNLSDLDFTIPIGQTGTIEFSGNVIPIQFKKGSGAVFSPDVLTLNSDNISSGRRRLGMLVYVYETNAIYRLTIENYDNLWSAATSSSGPGGQTVIISDFGTTVKNNSVAGQNFINAWTASTIEGVSGFTSANATWRILSFSGGPQPSSADTFVTGFTLTSNTITLTQNRNDQYSSFTISLSAYTGNTSTSGDYLPLSGGTVTGDTIFQSGLTANTISATTYFNLPVTADTFVTGFTLSSNTITLTQNRNDQYSGFSISLSAYTGSSVSGDYLPLSGGTVTGDTIFQSGLTANTISATTYFNLPVTADTFVTGFTLTANTITLTQNRADGYSSFTISLSAFTGSSVTSGDYLPLSGGTVTGNTIFNSGLTANTLNVTGNTLLSGLTAVTISATTYFNLPVTADTFVTGFTLSSNTITLTQNRTDQYSAFTVSLSAYTGTSISGLYLPLSGGTVTGGTIFQSGLTANTLTVTGNTLLSGLTATTISATTYNNLPNTLYTGNGTLSSNRIVNLSSYTLNFSSSTSPNNLFLSGGNVGIGTSTPSQKLDVSGNTNFTLGVSGFTRLVDTPGGYPTHLQAAYGNGLLSNNSIFNGSVWRYSNNGAASMLQMEPTLGQFIFYTANAGSSGGNVPFVETIRLVSGNTGINVSLPTNKLHVSGSTDPLKLEGVQTSTDTELLTIDGSGVVHKILTSSVGGVFLRNETNSGATDTITINQSIFNPSDLTVLSTSVFIVDTNADYYVLGDLYNNGSIIVNGTLKIGGVLYNYGTITGSGIIE